MAQIMQPRWLLQLEGVVVLAGSVFAYALLHAPWWLFALLLLAPDLSALGYAINVRVGMVSYNMVHTMLFPAILLLTGFLTGNGTAEAIALIWLAHIGMDRAAGFGLKYPTKFQDTHLQHV